nr:10943_t:CDS:2 [Entrophospora candida]
MSTFKFGSNFSLKGKYIFMQLRRWHNTQEVGSFYDDKVTKYAQKSTSLVTLKQLVKFGQPPLSPSALLESARHTRLGLPVRLARRVKALQNLPFIVGTNPYIKRIYKLYLETFKTISNFPEIVDEKTDIEFTEILTDTVRSHSENIPILSKGFQECKKYMSSENIKVFLDDMIRARIGIRLIAEQHIALHNSDDPNYIGVINTKLKPDKLIQTCSNFVKELCEIHYGSSPDYIINGQTDTMFTYVPVHLEYIISEILKNSYRATVEFSQKIKRDEHPPIEITISHGKNYIGIRVRDQGGGIDPKDLPNIFEYSYTTVPQFDDDDPNYYNENILAGVSKTGMQTGIGGPIAGLGYGLPLARIYANYFGGSMKLVSLHGHGCDVFIKLKHIDESLQDLQI